MAFASIEPSNSRNLSEKHWELAVMKNLIGNFEILLFFCDFQPKITHLKHVWPKFITESFVIFSRKAFLITYSSQETFEHSF